MQTEAEPFKHTWHIQPLSGGVGISLFNCTGYSITLTFTAEQARSIGKELIAEADALPRVGAPADLGCRAL